MTWLVVAWHLVQTKIGVQRITGINYATAWLLLWTLILVDADPGGR